MAAIVEITEFQRYELIRLLNKLHLGFVHSKFGEAFTAFLDGGALALTEDEIANLTHLINNLNLGMSHARMGDFLVGLMDPAKAYDLVKDLKTFERDHIHHLLNTLNEELAEVGFADLTLQAMDYVANNMAPAIAPLAFDTDLAATLAKKVGDDLSLGVVVKGGKAPFTYEWHWSKADDSDATALDPTDPGVSGGNPNPSVATATLVNHALSTASSGKYWVVVTDASKATITSTKCVVSVTTK